MNLLKAFFAALLGPSDPAENLTPGEAQRRLSESRSSQLVDVRSREEYQEVRIPGSRLIPLQELGSRLREVDKAKPVLLYCRGGHRSGIALRQLKAEGFRQVAQISGGIMAWMGMGLPTEKGG